MIDVTPIPPAPPPSRPRRSRLVPGILLMALGAWLLALNLGWSLPFSVFHVIPWLFIGIGVLGLSFPSPYASRARGAWLLGIGLYLASGFFGVYGLGWGTAWPIVIIGAGLAVILRRDWSDCCRGGGGPGRVLHG